MQKGITIIVPVLILLLSACEKEDSTVIDYRPEGFIHQVLNNGEPQYEYIYNKLNRLVEEKSKWHYCKYNYLNGRLVSSDHYVDQNIYSSNGILADAAINRKEWVSPKNTELYYTTVYSYHNGKLIKSVGRMNTCEYSYDEKYRIIRQTFLNDDVRTGYIDFIYDDNGNIGTELKYFINGNNETVLETTTEYEYDSMNNPFKDLVWLRIPGRYTNTNNIVRETYTIHSEVDPWIEEVQVKTYSYTYNSQNYPISRSDGMTYKYN